MGPGAHLRVGVTTHVPTKEWAEGKVTGTGPRWEVLTQAVMVKPKATVKGKYRDVLPSSEEFIRERRRELDLEEGE